MRWHHCAIAGAFFCAVASPCTQAQGPRLGERLRETFQRLDANGDKVIERAEVPEEALPAFNRLLARGDADKDGKLSAEEMRSLLVKVQTGAAPGGETRERRLRAMDKNRDGQVDKNEFTGRPEVFERMDADKNGTLSKSEIQREKP